MQTTSARYKSIFADVHRFEWKVSINGTEYSHAYIVKSINGKDCSPQIIHQMFPEGSPSIGNCVAGTFEITMLLPSSSIPRMAEIRPYFHLEDDGNDWYPAGVYYIDTRKEDEETGTTALVCYDAILKLDGLNGKSYNEIVDRDEEEWPKSMSFVADEIAGIIGVDIDSRTVIGSGDAYTVNYPNDLTMREVMGYIAAANGGNWSMNPSGELRLVKLTGDDSTTIALNQNFRNLKVSPAFAAWSKVTVYWADEDAYEAGTDSGRSIEADDPWATQDTADGILSIINGIAYQPFSAQGVILDPAAELGDRVSFISGNSTVYAHLWSLELSCNGLSPASIEAPGEEAVDHEYPYVSSANRALKRKVALGQPYFGVSISKKYGIQIEGINEQGTVTNRALFNSEVFSMDALIDGTMQPRIYFDPIRGDYVFNGALGADAIFTDSLYAELGFVAELTVDRLTTSRRVRKYLLQDTSDDNYIQIQDHYQKFITGSVISADVLDTEAGQHLLAQNNLYMAVEPPNDSYLVVQVTNRYGQRLYWQQEIVSVTADGYPLDENNRQIYATTEVTDWPVLSYAYAEQTKAEIAFEPDGQYYVPQIVLGAGDNHGNSRGYIYKRQTDLLMRYVTTNGKNVDIQFSDEGYVDALHRRLSYLHIMRDQVGTGGTIYYKVEGNDTMHTLEFVEIDGLLRYTWPDGHVCEVSVE